MKKYMKCSVVVLFLVFILDIILFKQAFDAFSCLVLLLSAAYFMYVFGIQQLDSPVFRGLGFLLVPLSILTNLIFLLLVVLIVANYPPEKPFKSRFDLQQPSVKEIKAQQELLSLLKEADSACFTLPKDMDWQKNKFDFSYPGFDQLLEDGCQSERQTLIDFIANRVTAIPYTEMGGELVIPMDYHIPNYAVLFKLFQIESTYIAGMLADGQNKMAGQRYLKLWQGVSQRLSSKEGLVNTMVTIRLISYLTELYSEKEFDLAPKTASTLVDLMADIPNLLDNSVADSFTREYALSKGYILQLSGAGASDSETTLLGYFGDQGGFLTNFEARFSKWPFIDPVVQLKFVEDLQWDFIEIQRLPFTEGKKRLEVLNQGIQDMAQNPYSLVNPVGRILSAIATPVFDNYIETKEKTKSEVISLTNLLQEVHLDMGE